MAGKHLSLLVHFTWSTAGREPWISSDWREPLYAYIGGIMNNKKSQTAQRWWHVRSHTPLCILALYSFDCRFRECS